MPDERRRYPALHRVGSGTAWLSVATVVGGVLAFAINQLFLGWPGSLIVIGVIAIVVVVQVPIVKAQIRKVSELARDDFLMCPECGYSLVGLSSKGKCPECGEPFEHSMLRQLWLSAIDEGSGEEKLEVPEKRFGEDLKR